MPQEVECQDPEPALPKLNKAYLKSQVAIIRLIEMVLALAAFICIQVAVTCKWLHLAPYNKNTFILVCETPNEHSHRFFSAVTVVTFIVDLVAYCMHVFSLMDVFTNIPWCLLILIQTGASSSLLLLASSVLTGSIYGSHTVLAAVLLGFLAAAVYGFHFIWEFWQHRKPAQVGSAAHGHDNDVSNTDDEADAGEEDPGDVQLNSVTLRRHSLELVAREATDTRTYFVEDKSACYANQTAAPSMSSSSSSFKSDGCLELYNCNSSGSDDKRSWVITGKEEAKAIEDNLSTNTFTVEAGVN